MWNAEFEWRTLRSDPPEVELHPEPDSLSPERESGGHRLHSGRRRPALESPKWRFPERCRGEQRRISKYEREKDLLSSANRAFMPNKRVQQGNEGVTRERVRKGIAREQQRIPG